MLDDFIGRGLDPARIRHGYFLKVLGGSIGSNANDFNPRFVAWKKSTIEGLAFRGFPVDCGSIPCADDQICDERYKLLV